MGNKQMQRWRAGACFAVVAALSAATSLSAASARVAPPPVEVPEAAALCPVTVEFGSYGAGIDGESLARIDRFLSHDRRVRQVERSRWGREGEVRLCVTPRRPADATALLRALRPLVAPHPRGPVHAATAAGASWTLPVPH